MALGEKLDRAKEALHVLTSHAADLRSKATLLACYAAVVKSFNDPTEIRFSLRIEGRVFPFHMRRMDLFTVAEILHEKQYALHSPLPAKPVIVDGGANVGVAALFFKATYPDAEIHCFEPEPENFRLLSENVKDLENVHAVQAAMGASEDPVELHLAEHAAVHSVKDVGVGERTVSVPCIRLDKYLAEHDIARVDLLKLDVEGSEDDVVEGLGDRLADVGALVGEMHTRLVDAPALYQRLEDAGFRVLHKTTFKFGEEEGVHGFEMARG